MAGDDPLSTIPPSGRDLHATRLPAPTAADAGVTTDGGAGPACGSIGNYVIERELGRGGMGVVYLATHARLPGRRYAVKLILASIQSTEATARFRREVEAVGQARHPNLVYAIDAGSHEGNPYLVTEFVEGRDLGRILGDRGRLTPAAACEIARQMAGGLEFAHANGIIHRDIKPQNVILQPSGQVKILDLGLAAVRGATGAEGSGDDVVGTPPYMPPEQWRRGETVTTAADIYAFGCTLFELLVGHPPFPIDEYPDIAAQRKAHLELQAPRLASIASHVPGEVARLIERCLDKTPARRPRDCAEIAAVLEAHAAPLVVSELLPSEDTVRTSAAAADLASLIDEPRGHDTVRTRLQFLAWLGLSFFAAVGGLTMAYLGPAATPAWDLRFDRLGNPNVPAGIGFTIEAARSAIFLSLVFVIAYQRFRIPVKRFFSPRFNTRRVWIARVIFALAVVAFLGAEFERHWFPANAATDMVAWAASHGIETTAAREVMPYRWYLGYSFVHYTFIFGGLLVLPILQFALDDLPFVRRAMTLFEAAQRADSNAMDAVDRLYGIARMFRRLVSRYIDTGGVLAVGVQYEYWIGRWTLSATGYLIEVIGMLVTAGMMVAILGYLTSLYATAIEITAAGRENRFDHRMEQRLQQFGLDWFLRTTVFSRPSGIALGSLVVLAIVAARWPAS